MRYCSQCLQPDTRPNTHFDIKGVCPACSYHREILKVDWKDRMNIMQEIIDKFPRRNGQGFDCIIGVSGGKDSTRQALWVRDKLKLNPLLVCLTYPPEQVTERGVDNISNLIELGFDTLVISLGPKTWRSALKKGFFDFTNWAKASEQAIISSVPQTALRYNIPLIFWGENPGMQLGDMATIGESGYDGNNLRFMNTVGGGEIDWLIESGFKRESLIQFQYPDPDQCKRHGLQIIYLGWFWNDWSLVNNGLYSALHGLRIRTDTVKETGDITQVSSLDEDWVTLNQMIKYYKYGFGRVTDYVNEAIRFGDISRDEGIQILEEYDGSCSDKYIADFCKYIDISVDEFWEQVNKACNKDLFQVGAYKRPQRLFEVGVGI